MLSLRCVLCSVRSVAFRLCNIADAFNYLLYPHFCGLNWWTAQEKQKKSKTEHLRAAYNTNTCWTVLEMTAAGH